jgi:hypothetical protein
MSARDLRVCHVTLRKDIRSRNRDDHAEARRRGHVGDPMARYAPNREEAAREHSYRARQGPHQAGRTRHLGIWRCGRPGGARWAAELEPRNAGTFALLGRAVLEAPAAPGGGRAGRRGSGGGGGGGGQLELTACGTGDARAWFRRGLAVDPNSVENWPASGARSSSIQRGPRDHRARPRTRAGSRAQRSARRSPRPHGALRQPRGSAHAPSGSPPTPPRPP